MTPADPPSNQFKGTIEPRPVASMVTEANDHLSKGRLEEASAVIVEILKHDPNNAELWKTLGIVFDHLLQSKEAISAYDKSLQIEPNQPGIMLQMGHLHKQIGDLDTSAAYYKQATEHKDQKGEAYWCLSNIKTYKFRDAEVADMDKTLIGLDGKSEDAAYLNFALAKSAEDHENYDSAYTYFATGNALKKTAIPYDPAGVEYGTDRMIKLFTPEFFQQRKDYGHPDPSPIFILGLPRSGSTLLEQILASHSQIDGTKELDNINQIIMRLMKDDGDVSVNPYPELVSNLSPGSCKAIGEHYIQDTRKYRGDAPYFIDKMPHNFLDIGLIQLILPNATIIDARRHPMGACFACFRQNFASSHAFSYDLENLGRYFINYSRLMDHWNFALPAKVLRVQYEDVIHDTENQVRRLLDHCGLPFEDSCLRFYETKRNVRTHSAEQVRQPIYTKGINFWRHYEKYLDPLKKALAPILDDY